MTLEGKQTGPTARIPTLAYRRRNVLAHQPDVVGLAASWVENEVLRPVAQIPAVLETAVGAHQGVEARSGHCAAVLKPIPHVIGSLEEGIQEVDGLLDGHTTVWV